MKKILLALVLLCAPAAAWASNCSGYSYTLTNGTTADATQVMSNFNTILGCANNNLANSASGVNSNITSFTQGVSFGSTVGVTGALTATTGLVLGTSAAILTNGSTGTWTASGDTAYNKGAAISFASTGAGGGLAFSTGTGATNSQVGSFTGAGNFVVNNNATVGGTLGVTGAFTATGSIVVGTSQAIVTNGSTGTWTISGDTAYNKGAAITLGSTGGGGGITFSTGTGGTNSAAGSISAAGNFTFNNNATVGGTFGATGAATFSSSVTAASFGGSALANAAQTLTGSSTTQAVTPGGFAGNSSIGGNGYYKLPGGLIIQWGTTGSIASNGTATVTYPVAFSNLYSVQATKLLATGNVNDSCNVVNVGTSQFQVSNGGTAASNVYWIAIGS